MKILKNIITIIAEIIILILAAIWFLRTKEEEPLIVMIGSGVFLIVSVLSKIFDKSQEPRPKVVFHKKKDFTMRSPLGYAPNNPEGIQAGIETPKKYWELSWSYTIEVRNNSSVTAYNNEIEYKNKPNRTELLGGIGKIQPIKPEDKFEFTFKLTQNVFETHIDADKYLKENAEKLLKDMKIIAKYSDEFGKNFTTEYNWITDNNEFK
jgi:hypothetical protein